MESRVLVVDDEKEIRAFLNKALSRLGGFHVELAESGEEALHKLDRERFDLVEALHREFHRSPEDSGDHRKGEYVGFRVQGSPFP